MDLIFLSICVLYGISVLYFAQKNDWTMLRFFLLVVMFQNILVILFSGKVSTSLITIFSLMKEGMLYIAVVLCALKKNVLKIKKMDLLLLTGVVMLLLKNLFVTSAPLSAAIISLRQCLIPFLGIIVGKSIRINKDSVGRLLKFNVRYSTVLAVLGIIELLFLGDAFWSKLGFAQYMFEKQGTLSSQLFRGVTRNFYTWDFGGVPVRRIVSITADPLATAHLIYIGFVIIAVGCVRYTSKKNRLNQYFMLAVLLFICSVLSLSKAIFVFMAVTIVVIMYYRNILPKSFVKYGAIFGGIIILMYVVKSIQELTSATATANHIVGLINGFKASSVFGTGLGTAGVMTAKIANNSIATTESYIGTFVQQIGYIGLAITLIYFWKIFSELRQKWIKYHDRFTILAITILLCIVIEMFFSESSVSIMGTCIYFIYIGMATKDESYSEEVSCVRRKI